MGFSVGLLVVYCIIAVISVIGSVYIAVSIYKFGASTINTKLVLYLLISQIVQDVTSMPYMYSHSSVACAIAGFIRIYSGFVNIFVVTIMVIAYRYVFFADCKWTAKFCENNVLPIILAPPLISIVPYFVDSHPYGDVNNGLCSYVSNSTDTGRIFLYILFSQLFFMATLNVSILTSTIIGVYRADPKMASKLFKSVGLYSIITTLFWVPRCLLAVFLTDDENVIYGNILVFLNGIGYFLIFLCEKKALKLLEQTFRPSMMSENDGDFNFEFSFDETETVDAANRSQAGTELHGRISEMSSVSNSSSSSSSNIRNSITSTRSLRTGAITNPIQASNAATGTVEV